MFDDLFRSSDWDPISEFCWQFYDCVLLQNIGPIPIGTEVPIIIIDIENSKITLQEDDDSMLWEGEIEYSFKGLSE